MEEIDWVMFVAVQLVLLQQKKLAQNLVVVVTDNFVEDSFVF